MRFGPLTLCDEVPVHFRNQDVAVPVSHLPELSFVTHIGAGFVLSRVGADQVVCEFLPYCLRYRLLAPPDLLAASA
jgi:hypothetical protein